MTAPMRDWVCGAVDDFPIFLQDRARADRSLYELDALTIAYGAEMIIANGAIPRVVKVGTWTDSTAATSANAQNYHLRFDDLREFHVASAKAADALASDCN